MILATASVLHRILASHPLHATTLLTILWAFVALFSALHIRINNLNIHSVVWASMVAYIAYRVRKLTAMVKSVEQKRQLARKAQWGIGMLFAFVPLSSILEAFQQVVLIRSG